MTDKKENIENSESLDFIRSKIREDVKNNKNEGKVITRFPPEPNGYLHIGHAKAICLNFSIAEEFGGQCHLRFDDTNPGNEYGQYIEAIKDDIRWLGFDWGECLYFASDYYEQLYDYALELINKGKAFVCDLSAEEIANYRGTLTEPGIESPYRDRSIEENLDLFKRMRAGEFPDGSKTLRAKIDMSSPNIHMRDPAIYRIKHISHHRTGNKWCIYPMYDFAHCISDSIEGITHSLCSLEFEVHRPLYDWFLSQLDVDCHPQQIEFSRLNLDFTVMSKRKLSYLIEKGFIDGWDDPRIMTLTALRRRGYSPESIRNFCDKVGMSKRENIINLGLLEHCVRDDLNKRAKRVMGILDPVKLILENYPENKVEEMDAINNPEDDSMGTRKVPFSKVLYIDKKDFREDPPKKFFRLYPGNEVRLRYGYLVTCTDYVKNEQTGEIKEIYCKYDPDSRGGSAPDGRKVKGTIHWVSANEAINAEVRLYDRLFNKPNPEESKSGDFTENINSDSLETRENCYLEPSLKNATPEEYYQFERVGYFCLDEKESKENKPVFNRTVSLKDTWAKIEKQLKQQKK